MIEKFYKLPQDIAARTDLPPSVKLVYAVTVDRIGNNGLCWPSIRTIGRDAGLSHQCVINALAKLESADLISVERRGRGKVNHYRTGTEPVKKVDRLKKPNQSRKLTSASQETLPLPVKKVDSNQTDPLNQRGAAAPPDSEQKTPGRNGAGGRLVKAWIDGYRRQMGRAFPTSAKGQLAGTIKRLLVDFSEDELTKAVQRWFSTARPDYGVQLFEARLRGGNAELLNRPVGPVEDSGLAAVHAAIRATMEGK